MPRYDFKNISSSNIIFKRKSKPQKDFSILLDDINYLDSSINSRFIKKLQYSFKEGSIIIEGLFDLSDKDIENLISFNYLKISFSDELKQAFKLEFDEPKINIKFNLNQQNEDIIKKNVEKLKKNFKEFDTDYKGYIKLSLNEFKNFDILELIKEEKKINFFEENDIKDEEDNDSEKNKEIKFFPITNEIKKEEVKIDESKNIKQNNSYIKMKDINLIKFPSIDKKVVSKILNKYLPSSKNKLNERICKNLLIPLTYNNSLISLGENTDNKNKKKNFILKSIPFNAELKNLNEEYMKNILLEFLNILIGYNNYNDPNNIMSINDYTYIVISFIKSIDKKLSNIKKENNKDIEYAYYIQRLEKINSSLRLFHILFLNCFISDDNHNFIDNSDNLYENYSSLKVQLMRKKLLIEWCMNEEKNYINKYDLININKSKRKEELTRQIISFGQIKTAIKNNKNVNLFINSKLSNLNLNNSNNTFSYMIKKQYARDDISKSFISYKSNDTSDKNKNSWISFLLQSLLYIEKSNEYIIPSIKLIEEKIKDMNDYSKPFMKKIDKEEKNIFQLSYVLLKIYENLIKGIDNIIDIEEFINMLSENNLFNKGHSDHFFQYIILYLITKAIQIHFPDKDKYYILNKKNYFLLIQIIGEILSDNNEENKILKLIIIMKLLSISNINNKSKQKLIIDIISNQNLSSIEFLWEQYNKENLKLINDLNKEYINGIYYLNKNNLFKAYQSFFKAEKYKLSLDIYMKYCFSLIKQKEFNDINFEEIYLNLNEINNKAPTLFNDFNLDFYQLISCVVNKEGTDEESLIELLKKFIIEYEEGQRNIYLDDISCRFIIKVLCKLLMDKNIINENLILIGDNKINELKNVLFCDKKDLWINIYNDLIEHKNIQFSFEEY